MDKHFGGKWHGISRAFLLGLLILAICSGIVYAAATFLHGNATIKVNEPMLVSYNWNDQGWLPLSNNFSINHEVYAGDVIIVGINVTSNSSGPVLVQLSITDPSGCFNLTGDILDPGVIIPGGSSVVSNVTCTVSSNTSTGDYILSIDFTRF